MAISAVSTINSYLSSSRTNAVKAGTTFSSSSACPTCNKSATGQTNQLYSGYTARTSSDSFFCATCNRGISATASTPFGANAGSSSRVTSSSGGTYTAAFCPTCNQTHAPTSAHWSGPATSSGSAMNSSVTVRTASSTAFVR